MQEVPLELRFKVLRKVSALSKQTELELILCKLWKVVITLASPSQLSQLENGGERSFWQQVSAAQLDTSGDW